MIQQAYRNMILPAFERIWKRRQTFSFLRQLEQSQWWSPLQLQKWQLQRLRTMLDHCVANSLYYRETWNRLGLKPDAIRSLADFSRWPITSRETMRQQKLRICSSDETMPVVSKSTGGSSGTPLQLVIDHDANDRRVAAAYRGYSWAGASPGTRQSHLWGVNLNDRPLRQRCKEWLYSRGLHRRDVMNSFEMSDETIPRYAARINRFRPKVLVAYTNPLYELARAIDEHGIRIHRPDSILVGAEKIYDFQRELIEKVFDAPVYETYGSREFTLIAAECDRHCGMHLTSELLLVEIVDADGQPVQPGQEGDIVVTDLFNIAMPFVRYAIGDRGIASDERCECGRGLPLLRKVVGRQLDVIVTPDRRRIAGELFPHLIKDFAAVRQFQVVQRRIDQLELKLVVDSRWSETDRAQIEHKVRQCTGPRMKTEITEVDSIPLTPAGKRRVVIGFADESGSAAARTA